MTNSENVEPKSGSSRISGVLDDSCQTKRSSSNEGSNDEQRQEGHSDSSEERNSLLSEVDRKQTTIKIDSSRLKKPDKFEEDQLPMNNNSGKDAEANGDNEMSPPDGGLRAWMIMIGSFVINGVLFSVINTYSLIYLELQKRLAEAGETEASSKAALVGSLTIGTTFFLSPVAGILTDKIGIQMTTFLGGALASSGMLLSSFLSNKVEFLYLTYGVMYGLGASLAYTPSLVILGHYFKRYLGLVNGIVTAGSSTFTILMPYLMDVLLRRFGLEGTLRSLSLLTAIVMGCAILFKPIPLNPTPRDKLKTKSNFRNRLKEVVNLSIWKKKRYVVWASSIPVALFGYFVPYVHIGKFVETVFTNADGKLPVMCIGITSGIGRLIFGYIADLPKVNRILLQQISFLSIGILTMLLPVTPSFSILLVISLSMGLFDGCFISLLGPIAFDICGREGATQAIGFLLGMCSIPLTVGPPIAGLLYDHTGSYDLPFLLAGVPPIIGALTMFLINCVKETKEEDSIDSSEENSANKIACQNGSTSKDFPSPSLSAAIKPGCGSNEQRNWKMLYQNMEPYNHNQYNASSCGFKESINSKEQGNRCSRNNRHSMYSESVPLLYENKKTRWPKANGLFERTARSSVLITF